MAASQSKITRSMLIFMIGGIALFSFPECAIGQPETFTSLLPYPEKTREFTVRENDSIVYTLKLALDPEGMPLFFYSNVFTPVCFTEVCKPVYIDLYWDLLGNYIRYEVPAGEPLTKVDHLEFEDADYEHLDRILRNPASILKDFSIYELVDTKTYTLSDSVDAVTGATPQTIRNEVIGGAVYTCYTIWHIVNGQVVNDIKAITENYCSPALLQQFLQSDNHHYQYWAINKVIDEKGIVNKSFLKDVLQIIRGKNIFTARYALEKVPSALFSSSDTLQNWLWSVYKTSNYSLQLNILEKLESVTLSDTLAVTLAGVLEDANEEQFSHILSLLIKQENLSETVVLNLCRQLDNPNPVYAKAAYDALTQLQSRTGSIRKKLKQYRKTKRRGSSH